MAATRLKDLARELNREYADVKGVLKHAYPNARDRHIAWKNMDARLTHEEVATVRDHAASGDWGPWPEVVDEVVDELETGLASIEGAESGALPDRWPKLEPRGGFEVRVHADLVEWAGSDHAGRVQREKLTRIVTQLIERGRVERAKSVQGAGAGWLRANMGGNGDRQFYLWFRSSPWKPEQPHRRGVVLVRAVRHHDETQDALDVGEADDYVTLDVREVVASASSALFLDPLTEAQRAATRSTSPLAIVHGTPGTGKTTTLHEVITRLPGRVLYLTFDRQLVERTRERDEALASPERTLRAETFDDFVASLAPDARAPLPFTEATRHFEEALRRRTPAQLADWNGRLAELFHEVYGHYVGFAVPWRWEGGPLESSDRPDPEDYVRRRATSIGRTPAEKAAELVGALEDADFDRIFARALRARGVAEAIARGSHDAALTSQPWDAVLLDEVQDLTVAELSVVAALAWRQAKVAGRLPLLRFAGDEGQTVRPTAFEWTTLKKLFNPCGHCASDELATNLRSPEILANLINNATGLLYGDLCRDQKPRGVQLAQPDAGNDGAVQRALLLDRAVQKKADSDEQRARRRELFEAIGRIPSAAVIVADATVRSDLAELAAETNSVILTAAEAKGLDFRVVALLDAGEALVRQQQRVADASEPLQQAFARLAADRLRVAMSRATETVVFVDSVPSQEAEALYARLGQRDTADRSEDAQFITTLPLADVLDALDADAHDALELLRGEVERLQQLIDESPAAAGATARRTLALLQRVRRQKNLGQAERDRARMWCGRALFRAGVAELRAAGSARAATLSGAASLLADAERPLHAGGLGIVATAARRLAQLATAEAPAAEELRKLANELDRVTNDARESRGDLHAALELLVVRAASAATPGPDAAKLHAALRGVSDKVAPGSAAVEAALGRFRREAILRLSEQANALPVAKVRERRPLAETVRALHDAHRAALDVHSVAETDLARLSAVVLEAEQRFPEAAESYVAAKRPSEAIRCYRVAGQSRDALRVATGGALPDDIDIIRWAAGLFELLEQPANPEHPLTPEEASRLEKRFAAALKTRTSRGHR